MLHILVLIGALLSGGGRGGVLTSGATLYSNHVYGAQAHIISQVPALLEPAAGGLARVHSPTATRALADKLKPGSDGLLAVILNIESIEDSNIESNIQDYFQTETDRYRPSHSNQLLGSESIESIFNEYSGFKLNKSLHYPEFKIIESDETGDEYTMKSRETDNVISEDPKSEEDDDQELFFESDISEPDYHETKLNVLTSNESENFQSGESKLNYPYNKENVSKTSDIDDYKLEISETKENVSEIIESREIETGESREFLGFESDEAKSTEIVSEKIESNEFESNYTTPDKSESQISDTDGDSYEFPESMSYESVGFKSDETKSKAINDLEFDQDSKYDLKSKSKESEGFHHDQAAFEKENITKWEANVSEFSYLKPNEFETKSAISQSKENSEKKTKESAEENASNVSGSKEFQDIESGFESGSEQDLSEQDESDAGEYFPPKAQRPKQVVKSKSIESLIDEIESGNGNKTNISKDPAFQLKCLVRHEHPDATQLNNLFGIVTTCTYGHPVSRKLFKENGLIISPPMPNRKVYGLPNILNEMEYISITVRSSTVATARVIGHILYVELVGSPRVSSYSVEMVERRRPDPSLNRRLLRLLSL